MSDEIEMWVSPKNRRVSDDDASLREWLERHGTNYVRDPDRLDRAGMIDDVVQMIARSYRAIRGLPMFAPRWAALVFHGGECAAFACSLEPSLTARQLSHRVMQAIEIADGCSGP